MLDPIGHGENTVLVEKFADRQFFRRCIFDPVVDVIRDLERGHILVPVFLVCLKRDGAVPLLLAHGEKFFRRIRHQRDVLKKENISVATERSLLRQRREFVLQSLPKFLERICPALDCTAQLLFFERGRSCERACHLAQTFANSVKVLGRDGGKWRWRFIEIRFALLQDRRNILDAGENFFAARFVIRRGNSQCFDECRECLLDVEIRIPFPARIDVEFPVDPR